MAKLNIYFNGTNYSIDEESLATARTALEAALESLATLPAGLYVDGVMTKSWDELISSGYIIIRDTYLQTNYRNSPDGKTNSSSKWLIGDLVLPNDGTVTVLNGHAFNLCNLLTGVKISNSVVDIGSSAFYDCSALTSVTIPDSVTRIRDYAFYNCTNLINITFTGTIEQWSAIDKNDTWHNGVPATHVHCTDGDIAL